jgi:hypothetical protein
MCNINEENIHMRNNKKKNCTRLDNKVHPNNGLCLWAHFSVERPLYYLNKNWHKYMEIPQIWKCPENPLLGSKF